MSSKCLSNSAEFRPHVLDSSRIWPKWSSLAENSVELGPNFVDPWKIWAIWVKYVFQIQVQLANIRRNSNAVGPMSAISAGVGPIWAAKSACIPRICAALVPEHQLRNMAFIRRDIHPRRTDLAPKLDRPPNHALPFSLSAPGGALRCPRATPGARAPDPTTRPADRGRARSARGWSPQLAWHRPRPDHAEKRGGPCLAVPLAQHTPCRCTRLQRASRRKSKAGVG